MTLPSRTTYGTWLDILRYAALNGLAKRGDAKKVIDKVRGEGRRGDGGGRGGEWGEGEREEKGEAVEAEVDGCWKMRESGMAPSSEMYHLWLDVILKEATNGAATVRDGIEVVKFMQKVGQVTYESLIGCCFCCRAAQSFCCCCSSSSSFSSSSSLTSARRSLPLAHSIVS